MSLLLGSGLLGGLLGGWLLSGSLFDGRLFGNRLLSSWLLSSWLLSGWLLSGWLLGSGFLSGLLGGWLFSGLLGGWLFSGLLGRLVLDHAFVIFLKSVAVFFSPFVSGALEADVVTKLFTLDPLVFLDLFDDCLFKFFFKFLGHGYLFLPSCLESTRYTGWLPSNRMAIIHIYKELRKSFAENYWFFSCLQFQSVIIKGITPSPKRADIPMNRFLKQFFVVVSYLQSGCSRHRPTPG